MAKQSNIRALATAPLAPFKHERVTVPEWEGQAVVVRALTAGDWADYRSEIAKARRASGADGDDPLPVNVIPATALVLVRTLFDEAGKRILADRDAADVAASFSEVHGRLVDKAFELSGISLVKEGEGGEPEPNDPMADAGND